ncbi:MAG: hypothetical protein IJV14_08745 [Lachnospiraceae bacterium]|nr:hypothetical protein [Lachnospiraceae bacterium]
MDRTVNYSESNQTEPLLPAYLPPHEHIEKSAGARKQRSGASERSAPAGLSCYFLQGRTALCGSREILPCNKVLLTAFLSGKRAVLRGSMTVEAALVLPLFLFFFSNILFFFEMIRLQSNMLAALHETGTEISEYAYFYRYGLDDLKEVIGSNEASEDLGSSEAAVGSYGISLLMSEGYVRSRVNKILGTGYLDRTCLEGGSGAISYLRSGILAGEEGKDLVKLVADYRVKPLIPMMAPSGFSLQSRYYGHAWVGYDLGAEDAPPDGDPGEETIVYITPTGTVYHRTRDCTYLKPSVRAVNASSLRGLRNDSGGKYYPCEACRPAAAGIVYICSDGNRYHGSSTCRSLKRTILEVPLSSVEDHRRACSKCGGG